MEEDIDFETKMGDGSEPDKGMFGKLLDGQRCLRLNHFSWPILQIGDL